MKPEHQKIMDELIAEHKFARAKVKTLHEAAHRFIQDKNALRDITDSIQTLASFYPAHIEKEDKHFFLPVMEYLSSEEQDQMLENFAAFDRSMIHEKYEKLIQAFPDATP